MVKKRFRDMTCVYCATAQSETGDHIFARSFFLKEHRGDLPQVPSCSDCNHAKSQIEHYLASVLPFGGRHAHAAGNLAEQVPRRLEENKKLHRELAAGRAVARLEDGGTVQSTTVLPLRPGALEELFGYIVRGLVWHHWGVVCPPSYKVDIMVLTHSGRVMMNDTIFALSIVNRIQENLGDGTVIYEGIQDQESPAVTAWRFHMYGGMMVADDVGNAGSVSTEIGAFTVPEGEQGDA